MAIEKELLDQLVEGRDQTSHPRGRRLSRWGKRPQCTTGSRPPATGMASKI